MEWREFEKSMLSTSSTFSTKQTERTEMNEFASPCVVQWATAGTPVVCPPGATSPAAPRSSQATTLSATA